MGAAPDGHWIQYPDLAASQSRVERLEAALRHEIVNCVNCEGTGTFTCGKCKDNVPHTCKRCAAARSALSDDAGEGA